MIEFSGILISQPEWLEIASLVFISVALWLSLTRSLKRLKAVSTWLKASLVIANLLVFIGLTGFILKPEIHSNILFKVRLNTGSEQLQPIDITDFELINDLLQENQNSNKKVNRILDPEQILLRYPDTEEMFVKGDGLLESQWQKFGNIKIDYQIPELKMGFINIEWNKSLNLGETLLISGEFQLATDSLSSGKNFTLRLLDPANGIVDEVQLQPNKRFRLTTKPKLAGNLRYQLEISENGLVEAPAKQFWQALDLNVTHYSKSRIAVIQSAPSFETKQLQNWAAEQGAQFFVKTTISRGKSIDRVTNFPELKQKKISPDFFQNFDLVIVDGRGFTELTPQQLSWLTDAVENGLGLLIIADQSLINFKREFELLKGVKLEADEAQQQSLSWLDNNNQWTIPNDLMLSSIATKLKFDKKQLINSQNLVIGADGKVVTHQHNIKQGRVAISLLRDSHQWVTSGARAYHSQYWQSMIHYVARRSNQRRILNTNRKAVNRVNQLTQLCIQSESIAKTMRLLPNGQVEFKQSLVLQKDPIIENKSCGYFWPNTAGWYQLVVEHNPLETTSLESTFLEKNSRLTSWIYIEDSNAWQAQQQLLKIKATLTKQQAYIHNNEKLRRNWNPVNPWFFWWIVTLGCAIIWLERKLF